MHNKTISELTVGELQSLIKKTVQESVAEVLMEFSIAAELDAALTYEAEMNECVRAFMQDRPASMLDYETALELDD